MKQNSWEIEISSFADTVRLVEKFVQQEIVRETTEKELYYHTIAHAMAVKRRACIIFNAIEPVLPQSKLTIELDRLKNLVSLCALSHDMVQQFALAADTPRKRLSGVSEVATANKLIEYIHKLNQTLRKKRVDTSFLFKKEDVAIIKDTILATICDGDPLAGKVTYSFSPYSIYQPYLYDLKPKISIAGKIIALADLGTLGMEGVEQFIKEGILVFLEDNLDLKNLILNCDYPELLVRETIKIRLVKMAKFMISLAQERLARFELEIAGFNPEARKILREQIFIYLNQENIDKIQAIVPASDDSSFAELLEFFCLNKKLNI